MLYNTDSKLQGFETNAAFDLKAKLSIFSINVDVVNFSFYDNKTSRKVLIITDGDDKIIVATTGQLKSWIDEHLRGLFNKLAEVAENSW